MLRMVGTVIVTIVLIVVVGLIVASLIRDKRKGKSVLCGGECSHCGHTCPHRMAAQQKAGQMRDQV